MELDQLKDSLNMKMAGAQQNRSVNQISGLLKGTATSVVQKLRRSILVELGIAIAFTAVSAGVMLLTDSWPFQGLFGILGVIAAAFIVALLLLLHKFKSLNANTPVNQNLRQLIGIMDLYRKRYLQLTVFLLPVCFALGVWLAYADPQNVLQPLDTTTVLLLSAVMLGLGALVFVFTRWYLRKQYGNYTAELRQILQELEGE